MTGQEFMRSVTNGEADIVRIMLDLLAEMGASYCVIGGLAVNAYAEPVVSLDLDMIVVADNVEALCDLAQGRGLKVERFPHSVNIGSARSDLRVQLQTDSRYQGFLGRASDKNVLGYAMRVARVEDVLQGKVWACLDATRRASKRQKDLADISRIVEANPSLRDSLPAAVRERLV
jgi:hypothetical protein